MSDPAERIQAARILIRVYGDGAEQEAFEQASAMARRGDREALREWERMHQLLLRLKTGKGQPVDA